MCFTVNNFNRNKLKTAGPGNALLRVLAFVMPGILIETGYKAGDFYYYIKIIYINSINFISLI